ncbi:MAG: hypothetical protein ABGX16_14275 [Pirellulales bacterium]
MKSSILVAVYLSVVSVGYAAESDVLPSDESESQETTIQNPVPKRLPLLRRLSAQFMEAFDADRQALASQLQPIEVPYPLVRGTFHIHSRLSHDSVGTLEEIILAAKATDTQIVGFTEHPSRSVDVVRENVKGWQGGVYFLAGTESKNQLHWPDREGEDQLRYVCHPEEVPTFDRALYDGIEIYNTHSDVKDEPTSALITAMLLNLAVVQTHPEAAFCSFLDYPQEFLNRFDRLSASAPFSGIGANDSHQNQRLKLEVHPDGTVVAYDGTGDPVWKAEGIQARLVMVALGQTSLPVEKKILADVQLDPYEISMRHIGTFLQLDEINEHSIRHALKTGRVVLGFELVAPMPVAGFWIEDDGTPIGTVGDKVEWREGMSLHVKLPLPAEIRVIRNGQTFRDAKSRTLEIESLPEGIYRLEAFQLTFRT